MIRSMRPLRARDFVRAISAWILATIVLSAVFMAGQSYLWCVPMQRTMASSCCERSVDPVAPAETTPSVGRGCCDGRTLGDLPSVVSQGAAPSLPSASLAFVTLPAQPSRPSVVPLHEPSFASRAPASARVGPIRAGPSLASRSCAALQVFRC